MYMEEFLHDIAHVARIMKEIQLFYVMEFDKSDRKMFDSPTYLISKLRIELTSPYDYIAF